MMFFKRGPQPLKRCNAIDPNVDISNSACDNYPLLMKFINKMNTEVNTNRIKNKQAWFEEYNILRPSEYIPTTTFTLDQEIKDMFTIELPKNPVWEKRGNYIRNTKTNEEIRHNKTIDDGWNYQRICWNPKPQEEVNAAEETINKNIRHHYWCCVNNMVDTEE